MENRININKYLDFDKVTGKFALTIVGEKIICEHKRVIRNHDGANEWCNHFVCELLNVYTGLSVYDSGYPGIQFEIEIPKNFSKNKEDVFSFIKTSIKKEYGIKAYSMFEKIIDDLPVSE